MAARAELSAQIAAKRAEAGNAEGGFTYTCGIAGCGKMFKHRQGVPSHLKMHVKMHRNVGTSRTARRRRLCSRRSRLRRRSERRCSKQA